MQETESVTTSALKQLLIELFEVRPDIKIKIRLAGENWSESFLTITHLARLTDDPPDFEGVIFNDPLAQRLIIVKDLKEVNRFLIDKSYPGYKKDTEYTVTHEVTSEK